MGNTLGAAHHCDAGLFDPQEQCMPICYGFGKNIPWLDIANYPALLELKDNAIIYLKDAFQITI